MITSINMTLETCTTMDNNNTVSFSKEIVGSNNKRSSSNDLKINHTLQNNHYQLDEDESNIEKFYKDKNILITGATGFLGKVLLWKLIDSCKDCGKIYVLLRSKKDVSAEKRLVQMLKSKPFEKYECNDLLKKIIAIDSDMTSPGLGLSLTARKLLQEEVNIVFHVAASVSFDAPLKANIRDNVIGTKYVLQLCKEIQNLKSMIHVSTAYSNCHRRDINEDLHKLERNPDDVIKMVECLPDDCVDKITGHLLEGRPNTYTYTKAMAEDLVAREINSFPVGIIRPSIVIPAAEEPKPGWVDNINGMAGLGTLASLGILRTIDWNYWAVADMVPVDYCANAIIVAGHKVANSNKLDKAPVYNMTSGNIKPISWGEFFQLLREQAVLRPSTKVVRPLIHPPKHTRANIITYKLTRVLSELFFAYFVDMLISLLGYKTLMVKITRKMHHGYEIMKPFTTKDWNFNSDNVLELTDSLSPSDKKKFFFDLRLLDWNVQAERVVHGARYYLLKEDNSEASYQIGRRRLRLVNAIHYFGLLLIICTWALAGYISARTLYSLVK